MTAELLEREDELERIGRALARARAGDGTVVLLQGEAGIGKSALVASARAGAAGAGMRVLRARGAELEREFAFGIARQLFEPPVHAAPDRDELVQGPAALAARLLGFPGAPPAGPEAAEPAADPLFAILHGLYWLTANLAAAGPLCLVVDDAHWADTSSLRFLNFLRTRIEELPVALVVAARRAEPGAPAEQLAALTEDPAVERIRPAPLGAVATARILELGLGAPPEPAFVAACIDATGGVPFLLHELTAGLREEGVAPRDDAAARVRALGVGRVGPWVRTRLGRLPADAVALAHAVAVLEESAAPTAAALAGLDGEATGAAADVLTRAGLLRAGRPLAFVHPMVRAAILDAIPAAARGRAHRRAAELLADVPGGRLAEHLLATEPAGDPWVVERLTAAAAAAEAAGAPESAAVLLRRVLAEPPPPELRAHLLLLLGLAEGNAGQRDAVAHLEAALAAAAPGGEQARCALALGETLFRLNRFGEAIDVLDRVAVGLDAELAGKLDVLVAGIAAHDMTTAPVHARRLAAVRARADAEPGAAPHLLSVAAFLAAEGNEPAEVCAGLAFRALVRHGGARTGPEDGILLNQVAITLLWSERWTALHELMDAAVAQGRASGDAGLLAGSLGYRSWMQLRRGRLAAAEADSRLALETADLPAPMLLRLVSAGVLVETLVERADHAGAEAVLDAHAGQVDRGHGPNAHLKLGRARLRLAQGRPDASLADALAVGVVADGIGISCPSVLAWRGEAAQAHLLLGDVAAARRLADAEVALARAFGAPRALGVALRIAGLAHADAALLREAVLLHEQAGAALELARARTDLGALLRRGNQRTQARELLAAAADGARALGGTLVAERAEVELAATGARARRAAHAGGDALTASERRVAELAAEGRTNRDIAQMLFVTAKTVEGHLRQVYLKLGVPGREALPDALR